MATLQEVIKASKAKSKSLEEAKALVKKWGETPLFEGVESLQDRMNYAVLYENQAQELLREATTTSDATGHENWSGVAMPIVRKIIDNIQIRNLIGFQPLVQPSGLVFYLNFKYGTTKPGYTAGQSLYGTTENVDTPTGGFYGFGKYGYASNLMTSSIACTVVSGSSNITQADVNFNSKYFSMISDSNCANVCKITFNTSTLTYFDTTAVDIVTFNSNSNFVEFPEFTKYDPSTNIVTIITSGAAATKPTTATLTIWYMRQNLDYDRGDFEDDGSDSLSIPEIDMDLTSTNINVKTKKLKAKFTAEVQQDMDRYHNIDAEGEITKMLSDRVSMEIDLEHFAMLNTYADNGNRGYWSAIPGYEWDSSVSGVNKFVENTSYAIPSKKIWYESLELKIREVSNKIHQRTLRGGANFIVCSTDVATIIESMPTFNETRTVDRDIKGFGSEKIGILANRFEVYKVPYFLNNVILMGYKGSSLLDVGAVYAPYIPLIMSPLVQDAVSFTPRKMIMTRFGKKMIRPDYYGKIYINGIA